MTDPTLAFTAELDRQTTVAKQVVDALTEMARGYGAATSDLNYLDIDVRALPSSECVQALLLARALFKEGYNIP
jgi:hypothetical protein